MRDKKKTIGIIGYGFMGSAIAERVKRRYHIFAFDKEREKVSNLINITVTDDIAGLVEQSDAVILAVKPQDFSGVLNEIKNHLNSQLIISIAAGITSGYIEKSLGAIRVVRAMPNMPARIGKGMTCLCKGRFATTGDLEFAEKLFKYVGQTIILTEEMMDAATAISGSGPGYYFDLVESNQDVYKKNPRKLLKDLNCSLTDAARSLGFSRKEGMFLAIGTGNASDYLLNKTRLSPGELKKQVASKGGTTQAALEVLHKGGSLVDAAEAALKRAKELSRK